MTIDELTARFPEIPADLHGEAVLAEFAEAFGPQLAIAEKPVACNVEQSAGNAFYMKLINSIGIYAIGLAKREMVIGQLQALVEGFRADPGGYAASLLPEGVSPVQVRGPGCE
jgi:hypothetical protein